VIALLTGVNPSSVPQHIAIIMDGNGRWAQKRHMPRTVGHAKGAAIVRDLVDACARRGVKVLTLFAFSTENWKRPADEVSTLMGLFMQYLEKELDNLAQAGVRLKVIGDIRAFPEALQQRVGKAETLTQHNDVITLVVAANYGGRWDIANAVSQWLAQPHNAGQAVTPEVLEQVIATGLSTADWPEPDLLIRTGGERRISNFLLWQAAYSELYFTDVLWPEFDVPQLDLAMAWYATRERRFGAVPSRDDGAEEPTPQARAA
jgi:undecaprenyl diphosphate synthase